MRDATCNSCGAAIVWAITDSGKRMPVDAQPAAGGNLALSEGADGYRVSADAGMFTQGEIPLHYSHFATCPNADDHRRPR